MMISNLPIAIAQLDFVVGNIAANKTKIEQTYHSQAKLGAAIVVYPECAITGYPAEDLLLMPYFQDEAMQAIEDLAAITSKYDCAMIVGGIWREEERLYNAAFWLEDGAIQRIFRKISLPNEGVFDERRIFTASIASEIVEWRGARISVIICEDMWHPRRMSHQFLNNTDLCIVINASPFEVEKLQRRHNVAKSLAQIYPHPIIYVNMVGGQDEIVFDGGSFCLDSNGEVTHQLPCFAENVSIIRLSKHEITPAPEKLESIYEALKMGLKSYVHKNGFKRVLIGLSGGIDSALVATIAADCLGAQNVHCVMLPSRFNSEGAMQDALELVKNLAVKHSIIPIEDAMQAIDSSLQPLNPDVPNDLARENIQSRIRGLLLMSISNSTGEMLLTTGNKSEVAVGYCTLYGDMCGAFNVLKDIYKTEVYQLCEWRNSQKSVIPLGIIARSPSAELRENQRDDDSLPPYDILDAILHLLIEQRKGGREIVELGYDQQIVQHVIKLVKNSEYKRSQAAIGVKISKMSFGRDWRIPITNQTNFGI